ncbi:RNA polymerase-associated protein LEO1-like [Nasonia vitripennis]|uniref:Uncharacterized protein n=1 Tax=Nasonia vitripennis TaxID=7425 RepID=A0A7M7HET9_NASVI|nr:RNA polymerase-associated protein LEO1-like [Nasonia vitripennis]
MHSLVLWLKADPRTSSILTDVEYLESLNVDVTGRIMTPERRKSFPNAVMVKKRKMASNKRKVTEAASSVYVKSNEKLLKEKSIFSDSADEYDEKETIHVKKCKGQDYSRKLFSEDRADKIKKDDRKLKENRRCDKKGNSNNIAKLSKKRRVKVTEERKNKGEQLREKGKKNIQQREKDAPERDDNEVLEDEKRNRDAADMSNKGVDRRDADGAAAAKCVQDQKPRQYVIAAGHSRNDELYGGEDAHDFGRDDENGEAVQNANDEFGNSENDEHRRAGVDVRGHNHDDEIPRGAAAGRDHDADNDENRDPNIKNSLVSDKPEEGKVNNYFYFKGCQEN